MTATLIDLTLKATLVLLVAGATTLLLRRRSAAVRHLVWTAAVSGVLLLPAAALTLPALRVPDLPTLVPSVALDMNDVKDERQAEASRETVLPVTITQPTEPLTDASPRRLTSTLLLDVVRVSWLIGTALVLAWLGVGLLRVAALTAVSTVVRDPRWLALLGLLARESGVARPVTLRRSLGPAMPMTWGVWRPVILLPADADTWPSERRRDVLLHELAHVRRQDFLTQLVASLACALYWFHPFAWVAARRLRVERERACDDQVIRSGRRPSDYAAHLLDVARSLAATRLIPLAGVAMARRSHLADRLLDVLDARRDRGGVPPRVAASLWAAAAMFVFPLAILNGVEERRQTLNGVEERRQGEASSGTVVERAAPTMPRRLTYGSPRRLPSTVFLDDSLKGCDSGRSSSHSSNINRNDDLMTISVTVGRCRVRLEVEGEVRFTPDFTDIASITGPGEAFLEVRDGRDVRRVDLRQRNDGTLERTYTVDGAARSYDAAARAWFADVLTYLFRRTGMYAEQRSQWILEHQGIDGLFREIALIGGDYGRRQYYQAAIESGKLDSKGYERVVTQAGKEIASDFELAELLVAVAESQPLSEAMQAGFAAAASSIDSDFERRRVLQTALRRTDLSAAVQGAMLEAATGIESDFELAELLIAIDHARAIDDRVREVFFRSVNSIESDFEHHRVLAAVADRGDASPEFLRAAVLSAATIDSDFELAQFLTDVAGRYTVDATLRGPYFEAVKTIDSDFELGRTLQAMVRPDADAAVLREVLVAARAIDSDFELAQLLVSVARARRIDDTLRPAFVAAMNGISSDYERERVARALERSGRAELD